MAKTRSEHPEYFLINTTTGPTDDTYFVEPNASQSVAWQHQSFVSRFANIPPNSKQFYALTTLPWAQTLAP